MKSVSNVGILNRLRAGQTAKVCMICPSASSVYRFIDCDRLDMIGKEHSSCFDASKRFAAADLRKESVTTVKARRRRVFEKDRNRPTYARR